MAGGHTVEDSELKYGLAVTGEVHPDQVAINGGARDGDFLILTKPIGTGVLATGIKAKWPNAQELEKQICTWAGQLNAGGAQVIRSCNLRGATDVTGFGLAGHALEMAKASNVHIQIAVHSIPLMDNAYELAAVGLVPAGAYANKAHCHTYVVGHDELDPILVDLMFDPQTSGGLLIAVPEPQVATVQDALKEHGDMAEVIGRVFATSEQGYDVGLSLR